MTYVEKLLGDSADKHAKELANLKAAHDKHASDLAGVKAAHVHHATIQDRVDYIEKKIGDSADKHAKEVQALKDAYAKHVVELTGVKASQGTNIRLEDRISYIEKLVGDSASKHMQELEAMKAHCNGTFAKFDQLHGGHSQHVGTLQERVDHLEQMIGHTADAHGRELSSLKDSHNRQASAHGQLAQHVDGLKSAHQQTTAHLNDNMIRAKNLEGAHLQHSQKLEGAIAQLGHGNPVHDRLNNMEAFLGDHFHKHSKELFALKDAHDQHGKILEGMHHSTSSRLDALENAITSYTDEKIKMTEEALNSTFKIMSRCGEGLQDERTGLKSGHVGARESP